MVQATKPENVMSGFRKTGIYPFNLEAIVFADPVPSLSSGTVIQTPKVHLRPQKAIQIPKRTIRLW